MIDKKLRQKGLGGSEVAAIVGLDPYRDAYSLWAEKTGKVSGKREATEAMQWGKWLEKSIIRGYGVITKQSTRWFDKTLQNTHRPWQVYTPDAFVVTSNAVRLGGVDAKKVAFHQRWLWRDNPPVHVQIQGQWYISASGLPWWEIATLFDNLKVYRIEPDAEAIERLLEAGHNFWFNHVQRDIPPEPGPSEATKRALMEIFPHNTEAIRPATSEEYELVSQLRQAKVNFAAASNILDGYENQIRLSIGLADGIDIGNDERITCKKSKDVEDVNWKALAIQNVDQDQLPGLVKKHTYVKRKGSRPLHVPRAWTAGIRDRDGNRIED